jgi:TRAP-type C4-dicarboxylate transport system permease small subunit
MIHNLLDRAYLACVWLAGLSIFCMSIIIPWGIFSRYVLERGSQWPEPVSILFMVMFTFFGAAAGVRAGTHISVDMVTDRISPARKKIAAHVVNLFMILLSGFMVIWGTKLCLGTMEQTVPDLPWMPVGITYLPVPLGGLMTLLFVLERAFFGAQTKRKVINIDPEIKEDAN